MNRKASILVGLLWCLALLSIVVIGVLHTSRMDLLVVKNYGDRIQAHYLALAGIEKAKALLYSDAKERSRNSRNHSGQLYDDPQQFRDIPFGRGQFRVFRRGRPDEGGGVMYGISDEESRLNINLASPDQLGRIKGMTPDVAAAIMDWRDADNSVTPGGAEAEYYASLQPPYQPRNGPIQTVRELLMIRGVSRELLLGRDLHQNGQLEPAGEAGADIMADDLDSGWAGMMTVDSLDKNVNAAGEDRINVQEADETALTSVRGISMDIARAIVSYRGQNRLQSLADLLDVVASQNSQNQNQARSSGRSGGNQSGQSPPDIQSGGGTNSAATGPKVINENLLMEIADDLAADSNTDQPGLININTASPDVLACLPAVDPELAQSIISYRQSNGSFPNIACLLRVQGMTPAIFKQVAAMVSARSETFRILSEGKVNSTGARQRIQMIVHVGLQDITPLSYREDDL